MKAEKLKYLSDFRIKTTLGLGLTSFILLMPFAIYQLNQGDLLIGIGAMIIVAIFGINAWNCFRGHYDPILTFAALAPAIILFLVYAFQEVGIISIFWCYPAVIGFYFMLPERQAWIVNIAFITIVLPTAWGVLEFPLAIRLSVSLIMVSIFSAILVRVISNQQSKLEEMAKIDPLTGLLNRTILHDSLDHAIQKSKRTGLPMTLIALDLDHFKAVNDTLGHNAGDIALRGVGEHLSRSVRHSDKVFRLGGEEFLVVLYDTDAVNGLQLAEELRRGIASLSTPPDNSMTVSIGVATLQSDEGWDEWMKRCDENLYRAKKGGRNRVIA